MNRDYLQAHEMSWLATLYAGPRGRQARPERGQSCQRRWSRRGPQSGEHELQPSDLASPTCGWPKSSARRSPRTAQDLHQPGHRRLGEVRDGASATYADAEKPAAWRNPCDIDRLFRRIKQFRARPARRRRLGGGNRAGISPARPMASRSTRCSAAGFAKGARLLRYRRRETERHRNRKRLKERMETRFTSSRWTWADADRPCPRRRVAPPARSKGSRQSPARRRA